MVLEKLETINKYGWCVAGIMSLIACMCVIYYIGYNNGVLDCARDWCVNNGGQYLGNGYCGVIG